MKRKKTKNGKRFETCFENDPSCFWPSRWFRLKTKLKLCSPSRESAVALMGCRSKILRVKIRRDMVWRRSRRFYKNMRPFNKILHVEMILLANGQNIWNRANRWVTQFSILSGSPGRPRSLGQHDRIGGVVARRLWDFINILNLLNTFTRTYLHLYHIRCGAFRLLAGSLWNFSTQRDEFVWYLLNCVGRYMPNYKILVRTYFFIVAI